MQKQGKAVQKNLMSRYYSPSNICCTIADDDHKNLLLGTLRVYAWRYAVLRQKNMKGIYLRDQMQPRSCLIQKANLEEALLEERWMERLPGLMWYGSMVHHVLCIPYSRDTNELPDVCLLTESVKFREPLVSFLFKGMHRFLGRRRSRDIIPPANFRNPSTGVCTCLRVECDRDNETV